MKQDNNHQPHEGFPSCGFSFPLHRYLQYQLIRRLLNQHLRSDLFLHSLNAHLQIAAYVGEDREVGGFKADRAVCLGGDDYGIGEGLGDWLSYVKILFYLTKSNTIPPNCAEWMLKNIQSCDII